MKAAEIASGVADVLNNRESTHGGKLENMQGIANLWNAYLKDRGLLADDIDAVDVPVMMILLKTSRSCEGDHTTLDHWQDIAGYAAIAGECAPLTAREVDVDVHEFNGELVTAKRGQRYEFGMGR